jgi:hypothetical protein
MTRIRGLQHDIPEGLLVTPGQTLRATIRVSAKHLLFCALGLMTLFVIYFEGVLLAAPMAVYLAFTHALQTETGNLKYTVSGS